MGMTEVLSEIITLLTSGLTQMATGIGSGLNDLVSNIFLVTGEGGAQSLSLFGAIAVCFCGVSLAVGLSKMITIWIQKLGK